MKTRYISSVLCDDVMEIIENLNDYEAIVFKGMAFCNPRTQGKRLDGDIMLHSDADMELFEIGHRYCLGTIPVMTVVNLLGNQSFAIKGRLDALEGTNPIIYDVHDLLDYLQVNEHDVDEYMRTYHDYRTEINWTRKTVTLTTFATFYDEPAKELTKTLTFPITADEYDNAIVGLQCWADATHEAEVQKEIEEYSKKRAGGTENA